MDAMDIDLDLEAPSPQDRLEAQEIDFDLTYDEQPPAPGDVNSPAPQVQLAEPLPETQPEEVQQHKIHVRGLDDLSTKDIEAFSLEHFPDIKPHVEWIDDSSANLVFDTPEIASEAILALTHVASSDATTFHPLQLRAAKPLSTKPDVHLHLRTAIATDRKRPRAHEASRYYLMHPEADPREARRHRGGDSRRRRHTTARSRQDRDDLDDSFAASMYDDDADALAARADERRHSHSSASSTRGRRGRGRDCRGARNRSASPGRDGDDRGAPRRRTPPPPYSRRDPHPASRANAGRELFPAKSSANRGAASDLKKELFPRKELFPDGAGARSRRSAFRNGDGARREDPAEAAADLFSSRMAVPFVDGARDEPPPLRSDTVPRPCVAADDFTIRGTGGRNGADGGLKIRGTAGDQGFAIRGAAAEAQRARETDKKVKELFPNRVENKGKELFIKGRAGARQTADTFF